MKCFSARQNNGSSTTALACQSEGQSAGFARRNTVWTGNSRVATSTARAPVGKELLGRRFRMFTLHSCCFHPLLRATNLILVNAITDVTSSHAVEGYCCQHLSWDTSSRGSAAKASLSKQHDLGSTKETNTGRWNMSSHGSNRINTYHFAGALVYVYVAYELAQGNRSQ